MSSAIHVVRGLVARWTVLDALVSFGLARAIGHGDVMSTSCCAPFPFRRGGIAEEPRGGRAVLSVVRFTDTAGAGLIVGGDALCLGTGRIFCAIAYGGITVEAFFEIA